MGQTLIRPSLRKFAFALAIPVIVSIAGILVWGQGGGSIGAKLYAGDNPTPTLTATATATPPPSPYPPIQKIPVLSDLLLTKQSPPPVTCASGTDDVTLQEVVGFPITSLDPKGGGFEQVLAAFEFEVRFDNSLVCVNLEPGPAWQDAICLVLDKDTSLLEGIARIACFTLKGDAPGDAGLHLANIVIRPQPDVYSIILTKEDVISVRLVNQDCELTDELSHPIPFSSCDDADITIRKEKKATPTFTSTNTPTSTATATATATATPTAPRIQKLPALSNLFLTDQPGPKIPPATCATGTNHMILQEVVASPITSLDPKGGGFQQELAAFEFEVRFDNKLLCVNLEPGPAWEDASCLVLDKDTSPLEGIARISCFTQKGHAPGDAGLHLANIVIRPQPEPYSQIRPNQENGITAQVLNQDCELGDELGHPIAFFSCEDADVTIRFLEGDTDADCDVDVVDGQSQAFRWNAELGNLLYNQWYDLEPSVEPGGINGDGDIDVKDIQFVTGRLGSTCAVPNPPQPPINPKADP